MPHKPLTKTLFLAGLQCPRLLWWRFHEPRAPELQPDDATRFVLERGFQVEFAARECFPGGAVIGSENGEVDRIQATRETIRSGATTVFNPCFEADGVFVAADILTKQPSGNWALVEVKSSTSVKDEHIPDAALQTYVATESGLPLERVDLMHLNRECCFPDLSNLFVRENVSQRIRGCMDGLPEKVREQLAVLRGSLPVAEIGEHCSTPRECPFWNRCWPEKPKHHVSTLYRIGKKFAATLERDGYETIPQLPDFMRLSSVQARQKKAVKADAVVVEKGLKRTLNKFRRPIAFLDFETVQPAIPVWDGCHPYDQIPVQFSCHVLAIDGSLVHHEWLATGPNDPRPEFADRLLAACAGARTILAYHAPFERKCVKEVAEALPLHSVLLMDLHGRIEDLLPVIRDNVYHPDFCGSFSLKKVLPALVPELSYGDLEVQEGQTASAFLETMLLQADQYDGRELAKLREDLLRYCEMDTHAMVALWGKLWDLME